MRGEREVGGSLLEILASMCDGFGCQNFVLKIFKFCVLEMIGWVMDSTQLRIEVQVYDG
jgi:hypothetical protein